MKSLLISSTYFPPQVGGISQFMFSLCAALGAERVCCLTGVRRSNEGARNRLEAPAFPLYSRPLAFSEAKAKQALGWGLAVGEIMLRERPAFVQLSTAYDGYLGLWLKRRLGLPYLVYAHGNEILAIENQEWDRPRAALKAAEFVVANSDFTAEQLRNRIGIDPERIIVIHPGCDLALFRPVEPRIDVLQRLLRGRTSRNVLLTVGNLVARKGHDMVLQAVLELRTRFPDLMYLIIGDGPYRRELERMTTELGLLDSVIFAGRLPADELPDAYALANVFVMPARAQMERDDVEGFGMVFIEANACGKPVVGGRSGGVSEAIVDGVTGLLATPEDPKDVADKLATLLSNRELAWRLGENGRKRALTDFNWSGFAERVHEIAVATVGERGGDRGW